MAKQTECTRFEFNLNEHICFKPTEYGKIIFKAYWMAYSTSTMDKVYELKVDEDGWSEMQLWAFMSIFGPHFHNGIGNNPCETQVILIDTVSEGLAICKQALQGKAPEEQK